MPGDTVKSRGGNGNQMLLEQGRNYVVDKKYNKLMTLLDKERDREGANIYRIAESYNISARPLGLTC